MARIDLVDLAHSYGGNDAALESFALKPVTMTWRQGGAYALLGPSGCGKTTLLNLISGIVTPSRGKILFDSGEVYIGGESISGMSDRRRTRFRAEHMGFVFQTYNLIPVLSGIENVELPLLVAGVRSKEARGRALSALEMVGLADQANKRPNEMSGGQQQRVTVARSLVNEPSIVWADEPTGALDSETSAEIMDLLVKLNQEKGQTFVWVTHDISVARRASRLVTMRDGRIQSEEPAVKGERDV